MLQKTIKTIKIPKKKNSLIRVANKPVFYQNWSSAGINHVKDILDQESNFLKFNDFKTIYKVKTSFLIYYGVVSSTKSLKKHLPTTTNSNNEPTCGKKLLSSSNLCSDAYKSVKKEISSTPTKSQEKWMSDCNIDEKSINWNHSYILPFRCTRETRLRTFQFKLLHRRIATNR